MRKPDSDAWWRATAQDDVIVVETGTGDEIVSRSEVDAWSDYSMPAVVVLDVLAAEMAESGYELAPLDDVLELIEAGHEVELKGRLRAFFETLEFRDYDGKFCEKLGCTVDFTADAVLGDFYQEFYEPDTDTWRELIPISAKVYDGIEDEQQWIGVDPALGDGPVYELFTSNAFEEAYASLDEFLSDLS